MSKKDNAKQNSKPVNALLMPIVNANAAGIDVSATMHAVAVPLDRDNEPVKEFGAFTEDLHAIAQWLLKCRITTVAMESTGVYWKQLFVVLLQYGFNVSLVNARHVKNVTGRKTDMDDAQWIQKLHSCGLLNSSFLLDDATESLRALVRHRKSLIDDSSKYILRMQKSLELMNIKIHSVIADIGGKTGTAIIKAIISGQRDPASFMQYINSRIKADKDTLLKSLTGNWREEQLFLLEQNYELHLSMQKSIAISDAKIESFLQMQAAVNTEGVIEQEPGPEAAKNKKNKKKTNKNTPDFDVQAYLLKIHRIDVTQIYGISNGAALSILAETGTDLSKWESENHFVSWLNLCPNNKITGGKVISSMVMSRKAGNATQAFRAAANSLQRSDHWLGDYFRRMKSKGGNKYAIVATARKLAIIYYKMVRYKKDFSPMDTDEYREKYKSAKIAYLEKQLTKLKAAV